MGKREDLLDRARDELFSHVHRCGVLNATKVDQEQWMEETVEYLAERFPDLNERDLATLHAAGLQFCKPAIPHGRSSRLDPPPDDGESGGAA